MERKFYCLESRNEKLFTKGKTYAVHHLGTKWVIYTNTGCFYEIRYNRECGNWWVHDMFDEEKDLAIFMLK